MTAGFMLIAILGVVGALIDVALHFLQLSSKVYLSNRAVAGLTLLGCVLMGISLVFAFNWGAAVMNLFVALMAIHSLITGKEAH